MAVSLHTCLGEPYFCRPPQVGETGQRSKERTMLVLSRKKNESIVINDDITIVVVEIRGPKEVPVHRREVFDAIHRNEVPAGDKAATKTDAAGNGGEK